MDLKTVREIPGYIKPYFSETSHIQYYWECEKSNRFKRDIEDRFICMKGFSSSTPVINSAAFGRKCTGGGFYFRYAGHGIVVDPGIGFTSLMHDYNIFISDIDVVIVTHAHVDHNCDVRILSALQHDYNDGKRREQSFFEEFFTCNKNEPRQITWYMDGGTIDATKDVLKGEPVYNLSKCCGSPVVLDGGIELSVIRTQHMRGGGESYGVKLRFGGGLETHSWGYTSDTRFFEELGHFFRDAQVLIFNISDAYRTDVEQEKERSGHLGYWGSMHLLNAAQPSLALASEFRCTNGDYRYEIAKALQEQSGTRILPATPGLVMALDGTHVKCSLCGRYPLASQVRAAHPATEYEDIHYICPNCLL